MLITFVCLGNICRSPMAEYIAKDYIEKHNLKNIEITSCGTDNYHEGEFMHRGTDKMLSLHNINHNDFVSKPINQKIFDKSDYIVVMDQSNYDDIVRKFGQNKKIIKITDFCDFDYSNVPDPWYTNDFEETYKILDNSINNFFNYLSKNN